MINYLQIYNLEEEALQKINRSGTEDKGGQNDRKRQKITPTQLEKSFQSTTIITPDLLKDLAKKTYKYPVLSLYLSFSALKTIGEPKKFTSYLNSMIKQELGNQAEYMKGLNHAQEKMLREDLEAVATFVVEKLLIDDFESIVIFKSDDELNCVVKLPLKIKDSFHIGDTPHTLPFEAILQENKKILIAHVTKGNATLSEYNLGNIKEIKHIEHQVPSEKVDKTRSKNQKHNLDHLNRHFKEIAEVIYKQTISHNFEHIVLIGHEEVTTKKFIAYLHPEVQNKLIATAYCSPDELANKNTIPTILRDALAKTQIQIEEQNEKELEAAKGTGRLLSDLEQVIHALNRGMVMNLYVDETYKQSGYMCADDNNLSLTKRECPVCGKTPQPVEDIVSKLVQVAQQNSRNIFLFTHNPEKMKPYGHVAALMYNIAD